MIELDDVFVLYPNGERQVAALRGLTLNVAGGERVVVAGPSGSGKSTLVKLVTGAIRPSAGRAVVLHHDLANASAAAILSLQRSGVGMITQNMAQSLAAELTGLENVALQSRLTGMPRRQAHRQAAQMMEQLGVGHLANRRLGSVSAGETQRIAIASALAHRPHVIVADEPTGALDETNANVVFDLLESVSQELGAALLIVSHDPAAARIGHRLLVIRDGRLGAEQLSGSPEERLVVDARGWLRIPAERREQAGITDRAVITDGPSATIELRSASAPSATAERPPTIIAPVEAPRDMVVVDEASRSIEATQVLAPVSLTVRSGELLVVSGRSGSGKTTLLALLAKFAVPSTGQVLHHTERIAITAASPGFAESASARDNIVLACTVRGQPVDADLASRIDALLAELGVLALADRALSTLSGGERQRVAIARALASDAELLLLDEPTSQLDQGLARRVSALLRRHAESGRAVVAASHEPELIRAASRELRL